MDFVDALPILTDVLVIEFLLFIGGFLRTSVTFKHFFVLVLLLSFDSTCILCWLVGGFVDRRNEFDFFIYAFRGALWGFYDIILIDFYAGLIR
jgi:hypothetical protein